MSLRMKAVMILLSIFVAYGIMEYGVQRFVVFPGFMSLERDEARERIDRCVGALREEIRRLDTLCRGMAAWDDTYAFVASPSDDYIKTSLAPTAFRSGNIDLLYVCDMQGKVVWGKVYDAEKKELPVLAELPDKDLTADHPLMFQEDDKAAVSEGGVRGIFMTSTGPMLVASRLIVSGTDHGPARGVLIMGRFFGDEALKSLMEQTRVTFRVISAMGDSMPKQAKSILSRFKADDPVLFEERDASSLMVYQMISDVRGIPALLMEAEAPRSMMAKGMTIMRYALISTMAAGLSVLLIMLILFWKTVLEPITHLWRRALEISMNGNLTERFSLRRDDEIGTLATQFDQMLDRLEKRTDELSLSNELLWREIDQRNRVEKALQEQLHFLQTLIDAIPAPIFIIDAKNLYQGCNGAFEAYLGLPRHEIIGKTLYDILPRNLAEKHHEMDPALDRKPGIQVQEASIQYADGKWRDVLFNKATFSSSDGTLAGMVGVMLDITDRKRAEKTLCRQNEYLAALHETTLGLISRLELGDLLEAIVVRAGALVGTSNGFVYFYNPETDLLEKQIGLGAHSTNAGFRIKPGEGLVGKVWELGEPMVVEDYSAWEGRHQDPRFDQLHWMVGIPLKSDAHVAGVLGLSCFKAGKGFDKEEISILSRFAELASIALDNARLYTRLNLELAERKRAEEDLREAKETADAASKAKSEFLASVSHEIRTPMNAILGMTRLTLDTNLTQEQQSYQEIILSSARSLLEILNAILDLSRIEAGRLEIEATSFNLPHLLNVLCDMFRERAAEKKINLTSYAADDVPSVVIGDPLRLKQVLINLIDNAVKFTDAGKISVRVERLEASEDGARVKLSFSVEDTGIGVAPDQIDRLFDSFTQVDGSTTRKYGGTGLGLAISKRLVEMMGGEFSVDSGPGKGSRFSFTAWLEHAEGMAAGEEIGTESELIGQIKGACILLVEDNFINQRVAAEMLRKAGVTVEIASNGLEAIQAVGRSRFDALLMDIRMPEMDGYDTTRQIHADPRFASLPIIAMTAHTMKGDRKKCMEAGMNDYVAKPVDAKQLFSVLAKWVHPEESKSDSSSVAGGLEAVVMDGDDRSSVTDSCREVSSSPEVDLEAALRRIGGNKRLLAKLMGGFCRKYTQVADEVRQEISRGETESALMLLHGLKGVAGNLSATMLYAATIELEARIRRGEISELGPILDKFEGILGQTIGCARSLQTAMESVPSDQSIEARTGTVEGLPATSVLHEPEAIDRQLTPLISIPAADGHASRAMDHELESNSRAPEGGSPQSETASEEPIEEYRMDLPSLLMELDGFLRNNDLDARDCVSYVREQIVLPELLDEVQLLWEQIMDLEFDKAKGTLAIIAMGLGITLEQGQ